ncbi:FKBP-type peptidyl-prolyl cis-trans isomerase [Aliiglaciecola sp. LCG003]|uniref:FKBP-type peptidyl-prolyl cis-trans isomerase n=1 Tax=Aliiglaciecola sp. LCG003 TaxID=3053655 RepID=UPI0025740406|nr:FKBP-type peptidyl-prolyl cis-trans isomerase [Aliiglaciecola sp. LCG003]WJG09322.1 FKBP-type peptidyl-prolyl cis-trans isomerase [Aliiglaciecola sp. LCG003]
MKKAAIALVVASVFGMTACQQQNADPLAVTEVTLDTEQQKQAYAYGASVGSFVEKQLAENKSLEIDLDNALVVKGFIAAMQGKSQFDATALHQLNSDFDKVVKEARLVQAEKNTQKGIDWLAENAKKDGVTVTDSGLQYQVLVEAEGDKPVAEDKVRVHYRGTLLDGTEFDSSYSRGEPAEFPLNRVIPGWTEGVQLMNVGSKFKFFIPSELAYGPRSTGKIPGNSALIFEVELLDIIGKPATN